jgi:nucleotide-binding universal stress UspA family protein
MSRIHRILFASDFSPASRPALASAVDLARALKAELVLTHALVPIVPVDGMYASHVDWDGLEEASSEAAQTELDRLVQAVRKRGLRATTVLTKGYAAEQIVRTAKAKKAQRAVLVTTREPGNGRLQRFRTASRLTPHVRHRHKYTDVPVTAREAFVFTRSGVRVGPAARTLSEFSRLLATCAPDVLEGHLRRHDFSRWITKVYRDRTLAAQVFALEEERKHLSTSSGTS